MDRFVSNLLRLAGTRQLRCQESLPRPSDILIEDALLLRMRLGDLKNVSDARRIGHLAGLTFATAFPYCPPALTRSQRSMWIEVRSPRFAEPIWADRRRTRSLGPAKSLVRTWPHY